MITLDHIPIFFSSLLLHIIGKSSDLVGRRGLLDELIAWRCRFLSGYMSNLIPYSELRVLSCHESVMPWSSLMVTNSIIVISDEDRGLCC